MADESAPDKLDRIARAMWEFLHENDEIDYLRAEVILGQGQEAEVLATDVAGGILWIGKAGGDDNRQIVLPSGESTRGWRN